MKKTLIYGIIALGILTIGAAVVLHVTKFGTTMPDASPAAVIGAQADGAPSALQPTPVVTLPDVPQFHYVEIIGGCNYAFVGDCVNMRSGPGTQYASVLRLREGMVFKVEADTTHSDDGHDWYKVIQDSDLRYPERVTSGWYIAADPDAVLSFQDPGDATLQPGTQPATTKRIVVHLSTQILDAYDGDTLFMEESVSTGVELTPTTVGTFTIYKRTPSRCMQGPLPGVSDEYYDLPGTPWDLYFTQEGAVLHGAYWHNDFGTPKSHGCVNQTPENAKKLYYWADLGTPVTIVK